MKRQTAVVVTMVGLLAASQAHAVDVVAMGDSMMRTVARVLRRDMRRQGIEVESAVTIGSGLARLDLFDWHAEAVSVMQKHQPTTVIVMMGANDNQPMRTSAGVIPFNASAWEVEYGRRVGRFMDLLLEGGAERVIWLGLPNMRDSDLNTDVERMTRIASQQADARDAVTYFSTNPIFSRQGGGYSSHITLPSGMPLEVRAEDGIHLNRQGAEHLAGILIERYFTD